MRPTRLSSVLCLCVTACSTLPPKPPAPAPTREPVAVRASFGRTWDAVVDYFSRNNIAVRTMERASGFVAAEPAHVGSVEAVQWADCGQVAGWVQQGKRTVAGYTPIPAQAAIYNFLVRGDSTSSTVIATVRWTVPERTDVVGRQTYQHPAVDCTTKGVWEAAAEQFVKTRAETRAASR